MRNFFPEIVLMSLLAVVCIAPLLIAEVSPSSATMFFDPQEITVTVGSIFSYKILAGDVEDLFSWEFKLRWNFTRVEFLDIALGPQWEDREANFSYTIYSSYIMVWCQLPLGSNGEETGPGLTLVAISFQCKGPGETILDLYDTQMLDSNLSPIVHQAIDGLVAQSQPTAKTWLVDDDGPADFHAIQEAINAANSRDTIYVKAGTYYENVIVNRAIYLIGEDVRTTIIDGNYAGDVVSIVSDNVTLSGFTIRNSGNGWASKGAFLYRVKNCNLTGNTLINNVFGIELCESYSNFLRHNNITNNKYNFVMQYSVHPQPQKLINDVDSSNIVDGKPIYYWVNKHNIEVPSDAGYVVLINCSDIIARDLKLARNDAFHIVFTTNCLISNNTLMDNLFGFLVFNSTGNEITGNNVTRNGGSIILFMSSKNKIIKNDISQNGRSFNGIMFYGYLQLIYSPNNTLSENNICYNVGGVYLDHSNGNRVFHNNFLSNSAPQAKCVESANIWDGGFPSGGNYWSDYNGTDSDGDGLGDTPHIIDANNTDRYPLVASFITFDAGVWNGTAYNVDVVSNSTVSKLQIDIAHKTVSVNVSGISETYGFCRITIPNVIVQELWQGNYMVLLNAEPWPFKNWTDNENTYIFINYTHSEHQITIIPEYPLLLILLLFTSLTALALSLPTKNTKLTFQTRFKHYSLISVSAVKGILEL